MVRWLGGVLVVGLIVLGFVAWQRSLAPASPPAASSQAPGDPTAAEPAPGAAGAPATSPEDGAAASGIAWTTPAGWREGDPRQMRLATYLVGGSDPHHMGECAVFYFGPGQGGGLDDNIDRWTGQFEATPKSARRTLKVHGLRVTRVEIAGTFLAPGEDMQSQGRLPSWKLLGAIVEGPKGMVFFKFTGPADLIDRSAGDFDALLASLQKL